MLQLPTWYFLVDFDKLGRQLDHSLLTAILLDGISFHGQTITAYVLMSYVNPVTYRYVVVLLVVVIVVGVVLIVVIVISVVNVVVVGVFWWFSEGL